MELDAWPGMRKDVPYQQDQRSAGSRHGTPPGTVPGRGDSEMEQRSGSLSSSCVLAPADVSLQDVLHNSST